MAIKNLLTSDKDPWMLAEDIPDIDFQFSEIWSSSFVNDLEKTTGKNYKKVLCVFRGLNTKFYYGTKDANDFALNALQKIIKSPSFGRSINKNIRRYADMLKKTSEQINPEYLNGLTNKELAEFYLKLDELHTELYTWGWLPNAVDMFYGNFTNYLKSILRFKLPEDQVNTALVTLSVFPEKSIVQQEQESFLRMVILKDNKAKFEQALDEHVHTYFYLKYLWVGKEGVYTKDYYLKEVKRFKDNAAEFLKKEEKVFSSTLKDRAKLIGKLQLTKTQRDIFDVYAEFAVTKLYRRDAQIFWSYQMRNMFSELSKRLGISVLDARFILPQEVAKFLRNGITITQKKEIRSRTKYCIYLGTKNAHVLLTGKKAKQLEKQIIKEVVQENINELSGQTACTGKAIGRVCIVNSSPEMKKMKQGDILVSIATNPDIVPAMKRAAAIVTEQGGITSHAAIVSRELGIPCIIGTKVATKVFKNGDMVEVDATKGIIKKV